MYERVCNVKSTPSPVPNIQVPSPEATSVTPFSWMCICKQIRIYILLPSKTPMGNALYTLLHLAFFIGRLFPISIQRYNYIYSCIVLYCIRICLINPLRKEDLVISNYRSCLHICPQSRPVEGSLGGTEAPPQEAQAHLHAHM